MAAADDSSDPRSATPQKRTKKQLPEISDLLEILAARDVSGIYILLYS